MNLIDAIKSKAHVRRRAWPEKAFLDTSVNIGARLNNDDLIADDWEIRETKVEISPAQFWGAYAQAQKDQMSEAGRVGYLIQYPLGAHWDIVPRVAKLLGLVRDVDAAPKKRPADEVLNARIETIIRETGIQPKVLDVSPDAFRELSEQFNAQRLSKSFWCATSIGLEFRGVLIIKGYVG